MFRLEPNVGGACHYHRNFEAARVDFVIASSPLKNGTVLRAGAEILKKNEARQRDSPLF
jgi:hypothetical protein